MHQRPLNHQYVPPETADHIPMCVTVAAGIVAKLSAARFDVVNAINFYHPFLFKIKSTHYLSRYLIVIYEWNNISISFIASSMLLSPIL